MAHSGGCNDMGMTSKDPIGIPKPGEITEFAREV